MNTSKTGIAILAIIITCGFVAGALGVIRLSNILEHDNTVGLSINLELQSTSTTPGGDLPDYASGELIQGMAYDFKLVYTTTNAIDQGKIVVEISMSGISLSDVGMSWTDATVWSAISWVDSGDVLTGTLGYVGSQPANEVVSYYCKMTYTTPGNYMFRAWVEGIIV